MRQKKELLKCTRCNRQNWHENVRCSWCNRPLPKSYDSWMMVVGIIGATLAMVAVLLKVFL